MKILPAFLLLGGAAILAGGLWLYTPDARRSVLEAEYAGPPSRFVVVAGARLHVRDTGPREAPALLLLHGFGSSLHTWDDWAATLSAKYRVIRLDLSGFGLTGADPTGDYSDARTEAILLGLLDTLQVARATLIGNSLGGKIAWQFAAKHPERTDRLVLISPDGFESPGFEYNKVPQVPILVRLLPYVLPKYFLRASLLPAYANPASLTPALFNRHWNMMRAPGVRSAILARLAQVRLQPPEPFLRRIQAPTLLLWGERDAMIPYGNAQDYLRALPHGRMISFPDLGHVPQEEAPVCSLAPVLTFLSER